MNAWKSEFRQSITDPAHLQDLPGQPADAVAAIQEVVKTYPMRISPHMLNLMKGKDTAIVRQFVPDPCELHDTAGIEDPLAEETNSPVPNLTHRYPDRVLFLVSGECPVYCRFCTRKRRIGRTDLVTRETIEAGLDYIRKTGEVKDVLLSGGDPLLLDDDVLARILAALRKMPHVEIVRIGSRVPAALPSRITPALIRVLKPFPSLFMNLHMNHPLEISPEFEAACRLLTGAGIPLAAQTVLLKGINDNAAVLENLFRRLLRLKIRPYYLLQADLTRGTGHFRTKVQEGIKIMEALRGPLSGLAVPQYVVDLPGGGGKVPLLPVYVEKWGKEIVFRNYKGKRFVYPQPEE